MHAHVNTYVVRRYIGVGLARAAAARARQALRRRHRRQPTAQQSHSGGTGVVQRGKRASRDISACTIMHVATHVALLAKRDDRNAYGHDERSAASRCAVSAVGPCAGDVRRAQVKSAWRRHGTWLHDACEEGVSARSTALSRIEGGDTRASVSGPARRASG